MQCTEQYTVVLVNHPTYRKHLSWFW